ncbi:colicin V family bacteriocin [Pectobacterium sp. B2J-2]|uniref:colicin V family bacteriocin n=1 Tax=Pectobacterium sp. B2J-2 TaxID=3385372 RepID=UPI0038FC9999
MKELTLDELSMVSGAGEVDWNQVGRDFAVGGATVAGAAFGTGLAGPVGGAIIGVTVGTGVGALWDWVGDEENMEPGLDEWSWLS